MVVIKYLREQAERCRRLARAVDDPTTRQRLDGLAAEYDAQAHQMDASRKAHPPVDN